MSELLATEDNILAELDYISPEVKMNLAIPPAEADKKSDKGPVSERPDDDDFND